MVAEKVFTPNLYYIIIFFYHPVLNGLLNFLHADQIEGKTARNEINLNDFSELKTSLFSKPIVLMGMAGCGKSSVGKILADKLNIKFVDLDNLIEKHFNKTIPEIFEQSGEKAFREIESKLLQDLLTNESMESKKIVLALGGGAACNAKSMQIILENAISFFIDVLPDEIIERMQKSRRKRPLLGSDETKIIKNVYKLYYDRYEFYNCASYRINGMVDQETIANKIKGVLEVTI